MKKEAVKTKFNFPPEFIFGTATSAGQSEGGLEHSDWRIWERSGRAPENGKASDKWNRYEEDLARLFELGLTHHFTTLEWSRIEPQKGVYDREALDHYRTMLEAGRRMGITLWLGLQHVTLPAWFARMGGFMDEAALMYWHRYVELIAKELGRLADYWTPILDPVFSAAGAYLLAKFPPGKCRLDKFSDFLLRLFRAHGDAYWLMKKYLPSKAKVGLCSLVAPVLPRDPEADSDRICAEFVDGFINQVPLDALLLGALRLPGKGAVEVPSCQKAADFFGINYFFPVVASKEKGQEAASCLTQLCSQPGMPGLRFGREVDVMTEHGFGAYPEGLYLALKRVHASGLELPLYITRCGVATVDESFRMQYLSQCLAEVMRALDQGINLGGFFYYSDVDTYEWNLGYGAHYGLFGFDPATFERKPRPAAEFLSQVARRE